MSTYPDYVDRGSSGSSVNRWLIVALIVVLGVLIVRMWDFGRGPLHNPNATLRPQHASGVNLGEGEKATIELFKMAKPSVVNITTTARRGFMNPVEIPEGTGTGFIWESDDKNNTAYIVTNFHVIQKASRARVTLDDDTERDATYVGGDPDTDLAVLQIELKDPVARLELGTSADLQVGQTVLAIGNPFGLDHSLTTGVISGLGREIRAVTGRVITNVIQTDAAINPGNSGGPLLDSQGHLIGVNTAIYSPSGANAGVGFAIPVDTVNKVVTQIIQNKPIERPALGVAIEDYRSRNGDVRGALLRELVANGPAEKAGLRAQDEETGTRGDIIVAINGKPVRSRSHVQQLIEQYEIGDEVTVTILRGAEKRDIKVTLEKRPS